MKCLTLLIQVVSSNFRFCLRAWRLTINMSTNATTKAVMKFRFSNYSTATTTIHCVFKLNPNNILHSVSWKVFLRLSWLIRIFFVNGKFTIQANHSTKYIGLKKFPSRVEWNHWLKGNNLLGLFFHLLDFLY